MRQSIAAIALIRRSDRGVTEWLAQWNERWQHFHFPGGHKNPDETFRECLLRELGEELLLHEPADFTAAPAPRAHLEFTAFSRSTGEETRYTMELFDVQLTGDPACTKVDRNARNRWLSEDEIRAHRAADGQPISETMGVLLEKVGLTS